MLYDRQPTPVFPGGGGGGRGCAPGAGGIKIYTEYLIRKDVRSLEAA